MTTVMHMVRLLLQHGANVNVWNHERTLTPLLKAIYFSLVGRNEPRPTDLILLLLEFGADPNMESDEGLTPLKYAVGQQDAWLVAEMLKRGANKTINKVVGGDGWNALHLAAIDINVPIIRLLLNAGADPDVRDSDNNKPVALLPSAIPRIRNSGTKPTHCSPSAAQLNPNCAKGEVTSVLILHGGLGGVLVQFAN